MKKASEKEIHPIAKMSKKYNMSNMITKMDSTKGAISFTNLM